VICVYSDLKTIDLRYILRVMHLVMFIEHCKAPIAYPASNIECLKS
jgi:hypothetical protein